MLPFTPTPPCTAIQGPLLNKQPIYPDLRAWGPCSASHLAHPKPLSSLSHRDLVPAVLRGNSYPAQRTSPLLQPQLRPKSMITKHSSEHPHLVSSRSPKRGLGMQSYQNTGNLLGRTLRVTKLELEASGCHHAPTNEAGNTFPLFRVSPR